MIRYLGSVAVMAVIGGFTSINAEHDPRQLLAEARIAAGGDAWNRVAEIVERGAVRIGNAQVSYHLFVDPKGHRFVYIQDDATHHGFGYDENGVWAIEKGFVQPLTAPADLALGRTAAYVARNGWWNRHDPATMSYVGQQTLDGKIYDVIRVIPKGGLPLLVFVNVATHLIAKIDQFDLYNVTTATTYGGYRRFQMLEYPLFRYIRDNGTPNYTQTTHVVQVKFLSKVRNADFMRPPNRLSGFISENAGSTTVPFDADNPEFPLIIVTARINGSRPLHLMLDTGGRNWMVPAVARELGLRTLPTTLWEIGFGAMNEAYIPHLKLTIGKATLLDQQFWVLPANAEVLHTTGKYTIDGSLGYELLRNFVVSIDYQHDTLTLNKPANFSGKNAGAPVHVWFASIGHWLAASGTPVVDAKIGKRTGLFLVDTGSGQYFAVSEAFLRSAGLDPRLQRAVAIRSWGGKNLAWLFRVPAVQIRSFTLRYPVLMSRQGTGKYMLASLNGDIGSSILSRFTVTFDYRHAIMYLRPNARFNRPFFGSLDGLSFRILPNLQHQVTSVISNSPGAAAGIRSGDIVLAVNGTPSRKIGRSDIYTIEMTHSTITFRLRRGGTKLTCVVLLKEVLPI